MKQISDTGWVLEDLPNGNTKFNRDIIYEELRTLSPNKGKKMNDNIHVTNAQMVEATALPNIPFDEFLDKEGNIIPFDLEDIFSQAEEDVKLDVSNTSH